jgi:hypothetical protein
VPATSQPIDSARDGYRVSGNTIQELTAAYKGWMSTDGWIFDAEYSNLDPYPYLSPGVSRVIQSGYE